MTLPLTHGSLFSGIGGFDLASEWMGWENIFHCEINPFGRRVLKYYWPNAKSHDDITQTDFTIYRGIVNVLSGGFPCQPYSAAGERKGKEDDRHLWPQMLRAIREIRPVDIVGENVYGIVNWGGGVVFDEVQASLEAEGYEVLPILLPAVGLKADHYRGRSWFVAHSNGLMLESLSKQRIKAVHGNKKKPSPIGTYPSVGRLFRSGNYTDIRRGDGLSGRLDTETIPFGRFRKESIKGFGNAIVPQVAYEIFKVVETIYTNPQPK